MLGELFQDRHTILSPLSVSPQIECVTDGRSGSITYSIGCGAHSCELLACFKLTGRCKRLLAWIVGSRESVGCSGWTLGAIFSSTVVFKAHTLCLI